MTDEDPNKLADQLEDELDRLQKHTEHLGGEVAGVRADWESKRADPGVPGAPAPEGDTDAGDTDAEQSAPGDEQSAPG
jgi:hypothetical protein